SNLYLRYASLLISHCGSTCKVGDSRISLRLDMSGTLSLSFPHCEVKLGHEELCRTNQWCQSFAFAGVEFNWYLEGSRFWLTSTRPAVFEVNCRVTGEKVVLPSSREQGYHGHSASDCADGTVHAFDITILELDGVCLRLRSQNACMNDLVKLGKQAEEQLLWVSQDLLAMRAGDHHQAAAEYHQAEHRTKTMVTACVEIQSKLRSFLQQQRYQQECATASSKIQCTWRQFLQQQRSQRDCAEQDRRNRRQKAERAITAFQRLWRLRQKRRQRRWQLEQSLEVETTPYDAILAVSSLAEFLSTREIKFLQKAESHFEIAKESRYRIVAVVGLFDKGKTWLINKLFGVKLASGKLCTTKGLSFLWIKERRMLVLDSAGVQSTVSYRAQAVDATHDAQTTESLMFEMVSRIAHHMVFVVNDLTWFEQKYVAMLHQKYVQSKQHKELIVVHNLRNTTDVQEAQKLFQRQVMLCYDGEPSHLGQLIFTADAGEGAPPVHHVGLCYEFSATGDAFNSKNRDYLLQSLEHGNTLGSNIVLTDLLCAELSRLLPKFVSIENTEPEASESIQCPAMLSVKFESRAEHADPHAESAVYTPLGSMCIHLSPEKAHLSTKTRGVISPLGEIIAHDVSFDPIVNVFDKSISTGIQRFIRIECPGVVDDDIEWEELPNGVKITINKKPPIEEHSVQPVEPIR
ncbi:unnamed protein product, partial [Durusdinium trenchii]